MVNLFQTSDTDDSHSSEGGEPQGDRTGGNLPGEQVTTPASDHATIPSQGEDATVAPSPAEDRADSDSPSLDDISYAGQGEGSDPENLENLPPADQPLPAESDSSLGEGAVGGQGDDTNRENGENVPLVADLSPEEPVTSLREGAVGGHRDDVDHRRRNPPTGPPIHFSNSIPVSTVNVVVFVALRNLYLYRCKGISLC